MEMLKHFREEVPKQPNIRFQISNVQSGTFKTPLNIGFFLLLLDSVNFIYLIFSYIKP